MFLVSTVTFYVCQIEFICEVYEYICVAYDYEYKIHDCVAQSLKEQDSCQLKLLNNMRETVVSVINELHEMVICVVKKVIVLKRWLSVSDKFLAHTATKWRNFSHAVIIKLTLH